MRNLSSLLERFSRILNKDSFTKETITQVIQSRSKVLLGPESFSFKDGVLAVSASAAAKNEIRLKEEGIIGELKNNKIFVSRIIYK